MIAKLPIDHPERVALRAEEKVVHDLGARLTAKEMELAELAERHAGWLKLAQLDLGEIDSTELLNIPSRPSADEIKNVEFEIRFIRSALDLQQARIESARRRFAKATSELNRPRYVALQRRILSALTDLASANEDEVLFFDALLDSGCHGGPLRPMRIAEIGGLSDPNARLASHKRELKEFLPEIL